MIFSEMFDFDALFAFEIAASDPSSTKHVVLCVLNGWLYFKLFSRRFSRIVFEEIFDLLSQFNLRSYLSSQLYSIKSTSYPVLVIEAGHYDHNNRVKARDDYNDKRKDTNIRFILGWTLLIERASQKPLRWLVSWSQYCWPQDYIPFRKRSLLLHRSRTAYQFIRRQRPGFKDHA